MPTLRPADLRAARDAVLDTEGRLAIAGAGTAAGWAGRLDPVDAVLDTTALTGVLTHNPGDLTVSVRAGTPLRALHEVLAPHRQRVAFDAARVGRGATVGGLIATADSGPLALRYGSMRDVVIGLTVLLADGTVARSGGHVIKNVAGYDLAKLLHGSYGTLAVLAEVVLRLHPVAERTATIALPCSLPDAAEQARRVLASPLEPVALEWRGGRLLVRLEGTVTAIDRRAGRLRALLGAEATAVAEDAWDQPARPADRDRLAVLRIGCRPSRLPGVLDELPVEQVCAGLGTGVATVTVTADAVEQVQQRVHAAGGTSVLHDRPDSVDAAAWGPPPSSVSVLRSVKRALDPDGRFGPGRFAPWM